MLNMNLNLNNLNAPYLERKFYPFQTEERKHEMENLQLKCDALEKDIENSNCQVDFFDVNTIIRVDFYPE